MCFSSLQRNNELETLCPSLMTHAHDECVSYRMAGSRSAGQIR
jgi:hypothetical protein